MGNKQLFEKQADGYNPIFPLVRLEDIIDTISDKSIQWIFNNYNHIYVEYSESVAITRNKVPQILRRTGIWISYNNGKEVVTEYYKGDNKDVTNYAQWTDDANWKKYNDLPDGTINYNHLSESLKQLFNEKVDVVNYPDEEDLTTDGTFLRFKDRKYEPHAYSGLGKVILRKRITIFENEVKNVLTQDMINESNTIYEIRYDFDLNGGEITIPEACVLDFQGGSFNNGTIIGYNTSISASANKIFNKINFLGTWDINHVYPDWFGIIYNEEVDNGDALKNAFTLAGISSGKNITINAGVIYYNPLSENTDVHSTGVKARLMLQNNCTLTMDDNTFLCVLPREYEGYTAIGAENVTDVHIKGGHIIGSIKTNNRNSGEWCYGICFWNVRNSSIENVESSYHSGDGFNLERRYGSKDTDIDNECINIIIINCLADNNGRQGLSIEGGKHIDIIDCKFSNTGVIKRLEPSRGIDIEPGPVNSEACHILIKGCRFENNLGGSILLYGNNKLSATDNLLDINVHDITITECNCDNFSEQRQIQGGIDIYASKINIEKSSFGLLYINAGEYINVKKNIFTSVIFSNRKINNSTEEKIFPISFVDIINNSISLQYYPEAIHFIPNYDYTDVVNVTNIKFIGNNVSSKNTVTGFVNNSSCKEHILFAKNSLINNREDVTPQIFSSNNTINNTIFSKKIDYRDGISIGSNNYIRDIYLEKNNIIKVTINTTKSCLFDLSISGFWNEVISDNPTIYTISSGYINSELITIRGKSTNHIIVGNITNISSLKCSLLIKVTETANFRLIMPDENISNVLIESYEVEDFIKDVPKYDWSIINGKPKWWIENKGLVDIKYLSNNYEFKLDLNNSDAAIFDITVENASIFFIIISGYWTDSRINKSCVYCCNINYDGTITVIDYKGSVEIENEYKIGSFEKVSNLKGSFALKASTSIARPTVNIIGNSITDVSYTMKSKDVLSELPIGYMKFSNNKPIWWTGTKWVDATGTEV